MYFTTEKCILLQRSIFHYKKSLFHDIVLEKCKIMNKMSWNVSGGTKEECENRNGKEIYQKLFIETMNATAGALTDKTEEVANDEESGDYIRGLCKGIVGDEDTSL